MSEDDYYLGSVTFRVPISLLKELAAKSGRGKPFRDKSDAIREMTKLGLKVFDLQQAYKDPAKREELQSKINSLMDFKDMEKEMETWDENQLNAILFIASNLKEKKVQLVLDDIKQS